MRAAEQKESRRNEDLQRTRCRPSLVDWRERDLPPGLSRVNDSRFFELKDRKPRFFPCFVGPLTVVIDGRQDDETGMSLRGLAR